MSMHSIAECTWLIRSIAYYGSMLENIIESEEVQPIVINSSPEKITYKIFPCDVCNQQLLTTKDLEKHNKKYHPVKHPCDTCWLIFDTERGMINHLGSVHQTRSSL